jgi:hypothetical protein
MVLLRKKTRYAATTYSPSTTPTDSYILIQNARGQRLLAVLAGHAQGVRCRDVVAALGEDPGVPRTVERVRHRLKKLVLAGLVVEPEPGVFTRAGDRGAAIG